MPVRKAVRGDFPRILSLAQDCGVDYAGMESDEFWLAEEDGEIAGIVGLQRRPDGLELVSLAVDPAHRSRGLARELTEALLAAAGGDVYLSTVIPDVFARLGFEPAGLVPPSLAAKKGTPWCAGCEAPERCAVMVRRAR